MQIPLHYDPRWYQAEAIRALEEGVRFAVWCWARRGGKDMTAFAYAVKKMIESPMNVVLVFPTKKQGFDNFWTNVENDGFKTLDHIPAALIASKSNSPDNMKITLINGSTFTLLGATDPEALRGANGQLYILSEFVDIPAGVLGVIRPIVAVNGGQIIVQSTPKIDGISGATFKTLFDRAKTHPKQFASRILATEYLTAEELEDIRQDYIAEYGNDFLFRQEFLCDWGQTSQTSYYGEILQILEKNKKIGSFPYDDKYPVYTAWDLGMADQTAVTFFQYFLVDNKPQVRIIDYYESNNLKSEAHVKFIQAKPYNYGWHFFPHDAKVRDSDAIERIEKIREHGLTNSSVLRREPKEDGIGRVATKLREAVIHAPMTINLVKKLKLFKRKFNGVTGDYEGPEHKTESHAADSTKYLFQAVEMEFDKENCELLYSQSGESDVYESEFDDLSTTVYSPST
jgi:phage terminase large subunit